MSNAIEIHNLTVSFNVHKKKFTAVDHLTLNVGKGQVFGFLGPNGAGKTTTMHVLLGFVEPTSGNASIFGTDVKESIARQVIGYLPEHPDTYRFLTGRELLKMTGKLFLMGKKETQERIDSIVEKVQLQDALDRRIGTYSRGMMQRICMAQAIINDPELVILDEPTGGLDPIGRRKIREIIGDLKERGKTVFFSSHELSEVELICDNIAIIGSGRVIEQGAVKDIVKDGESLERFFINKVGN